MKDLLLRVLTKDEIEMIHHTSLSILEEVGMVVKYPAAVKVLRDAGAIVSRKKELVQLPKGLVKKIMKFAPRKVVLYDRRGGYTVLPSSEHHHFAGADMLYTEDFNTGTIRASTIKDLSDFTRLSDYLTMIHGVYPEVYACDVEKPVSELYTMATLVTNTSKHCAFAPLNFRASEAWIQIGEILSDGEELSRKPVISTMISTTSPLQFDRESTKILMSIAQRRLPLIILPQPISGATSPMTLAGTLAIQNAEFLFALTLAQITGRGTPIIYGAATTSMDMRSGNVAIGGPEFSLIFTSTAQMADFYNLPSYVPISQTNSKVVDVQAGAEKMAAYLAAILSGLDLSVGAGALANSMIASLEQMVIDHEMLAWVNRFKEGMVVDRETLTLDTIKDVKPGGNYLDHEHTLKWLRKAEHFVSELFDRDIVQSPRKIMVKRAKKKVEEILNDHKPEIPVEIIESIEEFVRRHRKEAI